MQKANGAIEWTQTFNGTANNYDIATAIAINDSSIYVTGVTSSLNTLLDYHTLKYQINGTLLWSVNFDYYNLLDIPFAISYSQEDSNIVVTGGSQSSIYDWDYQTNIYKYNGTTVDLGRVSGTSVGFDRATAVKTDSLGNIYITGATRENNSNFDIKTVKLDKLGNLIWQRTFDNNGGNDIANDLVVNNAGEIYLVGTIEGNGSDYLVMRLDASNGGIVWQNTIDCGANDTARAICFDSRGNIVITGQAFNPENANYDFLTVNFDRAGQELWRDYFDGPDHGDDNATNIVSDNEGNIFVTGQTWVGNDFHTVTIKYKTDFFTQPPAVDTPAVAYLFYPNSGQLVNTDDSLVTDSVHYYTLHHSPQLYFGYGMMNMVWSHVDEDTATVDTLQRVDVTFANSTNPTEAYPIDEDTSSYLNYFLGHCPNGITNVHGSASLLFTDVYPDIDVLYSSNNAGLKLLFIINPGASIPQEMGLAFAGDDGISVLNNWGLNVHTTLGDYEFEKPHAYQIDTSGNRVALTWHLNWKVVSSTEANFTGWGSYDSSEPLIIEMSKSIQASNLTPIQNLLWSTHFGGNNGETASQITKDNSNFIYTVGTTTSISFPAGGVLLVGQTINKGSSDAFVTKFSAGPGTPINSNQKWSTFYGGTRAEEGRSIAVNSVLSTIYIVGTTLTTDGSLAAPNPFGSTDFKNTHQGGGLDGYYAKFNLNGILISASFIGGGEPDGAFTVAVNETDGTIFLGGHTMSDGLNTAIFPTKQSTTNSYFQNVYGGNITTTIQPGNIVVPVGLGDGFIMKFNDADQLIWSTFFGGEGEEVVTGIKVLNNNDIVVVGNTNSFTTNSSVASPYCLANNSNEFQLCDQGGTSYFDNIYNTSNSQPTVGDYDLFITAFNSNNELIWSTYLGGDKSDFIHDNALTGTFSNSDNFSIIGESNSSTNSFPVTTPSGSYSQGYSGGVGSPPDAFIASFTNEFNLTWCSFYGGNNFDIGRGITFDSNDNLYITGDTKSNAFTTSCTGPSNGDFPLCDDNLSFYYNNNLNLTFQNTTGDAFLAQFDQNYALHWSTYIGGTRDETGNSLIVNENGNENRLFFYGWTSSPKSEPLFGNGLFPLAASLGYFNQIYDLLGNNDDQIAMFDLGNIVGINEIKNQDFELTLSPNPTSDYLVINLKLISNKENKLIFFNINDINGRILVNEKIEKIVGNEYRKIIGLNNISPGIYFVSIFTGNNIMNAKFIKCK